MEPTVKIAAIVVRSLLGLLFLFASVTYFLKLVPQPPLSGAMKTFNDGLLASVYLVPTAKAVELVCGLAFLSGRLVPLATLLIAPIIVNIAGVHLFLVPEGRLLAAALVLATGFLAYCHREAYRPLFKL